METLLVVDDRKELLDMISFYLEVEGYEVIKASNGPDALAACDLHPEPIHILLTDIDMYPMDGLQLATAIRLKLSEVRILFMSARRNKLALDWLTADPGVSFIAKPFSSEALVAKIQELMGREPPS